MRIIPNSKLQLSTEEMKSWPYWGYGYYGTDGCDWRQYYTSEGWKGIPSYAEECWPMKRENMPTTFL